MTINFDKMLRGKKQKEEINPVHGEESHMKPLHKVQISKDYYVQCTWEEEANLLTQKGLEGM